MRARLIDGKAIAESIRKDVARGAAELFSKKGVRPGLAVILVGEDPASQIYVRNKGKAAAEAGFSSWQFTYSTDVKPAEVFAKIGELNRDPKVHGILVQMPLPKQFDSAQIIEAIDPAKDVDGFHPVNVGKLAAGLPGPRPCTPQGCIRLLDEAGCKLEGAEAVVVGRSNIVGKPVALLLLERNATVTICHSRSKDLKSIVSRADVVVAAVGKAKLIRGDWIKKGAYVIDVGMNRPQGAKLCGDVDFDAALERATAITPVPGGVGPMTIAYLLSNTLEAARRAAEEKKK